MQTIYCSWEEFRDQMILEEDNTDLVYRGHASHQWTLQTTLCRFTQKESMLANEYYTILQQVLEDPLIKNNDHFSKFVFSKIQF